MNDFSPDTLFAIAQETLGAFFWPVLAAALVLAIAVVLAAMRAYRSGRGLRGGIVAGLIAGGVVTAAATLLVPAWTHAEVRDLQSAIDVAFAVLLALIPGAVAAGIVFAVAALTRSARRA